jgi:hypothetical protein
MLFAFLDLSGKSKTKKGGNVVFCALIVSSFCRVSCYVWSCCQLFVRPFAEKTLVGTWTGPMCSLMSSPQQSGRITDNVVLVWSKQLEVWVLFCCHDLNPDVMPHHAYVLNYLPLLSFVLLYFPDINTTLILNQGRVYVWKIQQGEGQQENTMQDMLRKGNVMNVLCTNIA